MNDGNRGTRSSALWGKTGGRARKLVVVFALLAGLALASAPVAGAASWADRASSTLASWAD
jgi:hypothetical protein